MPTFNGTNGDDTIIGSTGNDDIDGRRGDDYLDGDGGDDFIEGGDGNDTLIGGTGDDTLRGEKNDDDLDGGAGDDVLDGGSGNDTLTGGDGHDELLGISGSDELDGGDGNDTLEGGSGADTLIGGLGDDNLDGGSDSDSIDGGDGNDSIEGGSGHDTIAGGDGNDTINGGSGMDTVVFAGSIQDYSVSTVGGVTTVVGNGTQGTDTVEEVETLVFDDYTLDLTGGNNAPVAFDDDVSGDEDTQITGNVLNDNGNGADFDFEGDTLSVVAAIITTANGGTVNLLADGSFTYDPALNFNGTDSFDYTVSDGTLTNTGTVTITVNPVNDAPEAQDDAFSGNEDTQITGSVLLDNGSGADSDLDGDSLSVVAAVITTANGGTVNLLADGTFTYDPAANFNGTDTFDYTLTDGALTDTATVTLTVNAVNDAPTAEADSFTGDEDTQITGNVLDDNGNGADSDIDGDSISVVAAVITTANGGTVNLLADGSFTYDPALNFNGTDTFDYTLTDGLLDSTGTVTLTVNAVNDAPVAADDSFSGDEDTQITGNVLDDNGNGADSDVDGDSLSVVAAVITTANGGTVTLLADGSFTYDPALNFNGTDTFDYTLTDGSLTDTATATITVNAVNDAPVAADDNFTGDEDTQITGNVLDDNGNGVDSDLDGDSISVVASVITTANGGTVTLLADGSFTYDPAADFNGTDSFDYTLTDGSLTDTGTVNLTVNAVNDAPTAGDDSAATPVDTAVDVNVLTNDDDPEGDTLTITSFDQGEFGTVVETSPGVLSYTPNAGFSGTDAFIYVISDGNGGFSTATVTVTVGDPPTGNTAPTALDGAIEFTYEDAGPNVLTLDFNTLTVDGQPIISDAEQTIAQLDISAIGLEGGGRISLTFVETIPGSNIFTVDLSGLNLSDGDFRNFQIEYTVDDGQGSNSTATAVIDLTVTNPEEEPGNTAPVAGDDTVTQTEADGTITVNMAALGGLSTDADGDPLTVTSIVFTDEFGTPLGFDPLEASGTAESGGIVSFDPNVFGLAAGVSGTFLMHYTVSDGTASDSGVVTLNLTGSATNTAPTTTPGSETRVLPDDIILSSNDIQFDLNSLVDDIDQDTLTIALVSITDASGATIPIVDPLNDVVGGDGIITGTINDGVVTINVTELELDAGESLDFVINYTVSDGVNPPVAGTVDVTVDGPDPAPTGTVVEDFEGHAPDPGFFADLTDIGGLGFEGSAVVFELDEMGGRAAEGLIAGETTIDESTGAPNGNAAVIEGVFQGFDGAGLPEYAFTAFAPGSTLTSFTTDSIFAFNPDDVFGTAFDLESMSLTALAEETTTVTIIPYRIVSLGGNEYEYVAVGEFEVTISNTTATSLDFTSGQFTDALIFDDPNTTEVETSALENIVAVQFVTTGSLLENNGEGAGGEIIPQFDDPLVIDDLVFDF